MGMTEAERKAVNKALKLNGAAMVRRLAHGRYAVPSASQEGAAYEVTGTGLWLKDYRCSCPAGASGKVCWHVASVRLRRTQEDARSQVRRLLERRESSPTPSRRGRLEVSLL